MHTYALLLYIILTVLLTLSLHKKHISGMNKTTCSSDPFPTRLLMSHLHAHCTHFTAHCKSMFDHGDFLIYL